MKIFINILFYFIGLQLCTAQINISGVVKDTLGSPLELANIILIDSESGSLETFAMSNENGYYKMSMKKNKTYKLQVSYIGMNTLSQSLQTNEVDIIKDFVLKSNNQLDAVELTYEMPVVISGDTLVYDADSFSTGTERKLEDILENLPGVEVNDDGEIEVEGKVCLLYTYDAADE